MQAGGTLAHETVTADNKYRLIAELGRGGMATVYLAMARGPAGFNKLQVVKRLRPLLAEDPQFLQMFLDEARLAARINHPNVVQTNEVGFDGQYYYIGMEYLEGQTLKAIVQRAKKTEQDFPRNLHIRVLCEALAGLHAAHELQDFDGRPLRVVHRDMSPHNVMVTYEGGVKVLDFGIAKAADAREDTRSGLIKGKCAYMSFEQFGGKDVDRRSDIFAVGVMLWQAVTGQPLWGEISDAQILARLVHHDIPSPRTVDPDIPEELESICMKALAQEREDRYATAADFQTALENYLHDSGAKERVRDLGKYVALLFDDRRKEIAARIEERICEIDTNAHEVPAALTSVPTLLGPSGPAKAVRGPMESSGTLAPATDVPLPTRRWPRIALVAALLGGIGIVALAGLNERETVATPDTAPSGSQGTANDRVQLEITASPKEAKIFLDGAPLRSNPARNTYIRDGTSHHIRAEASGYVTSNRMVTFDVPQISVDMVLLPEEPTVDQNDAKTSPANRVVTRRRGSVVRPREPKESVAEPPRPPAPPPPAQPPRPQLPEIDTGNPWAK